MTTPPSGSVSVHVVDSGRWDDCRALWLSLRDHSGAVEPQLGALRGDDESWLMAHSLWADALAKPGSFLVLGEDQRQVPSVPLACAAVSIAGGSPSWSEPASYGYVEVLAVAPHARGKGLGTAVMQTVRDELARRGIDEIRLLVTVHNERAQAFYRRAGFEPFGLIVRRPPDSS